MQTDLDLNTRLERCWTEKDQWLTMADIAEKLGVTYKENEYKYIHRLLWRAYHQERIQRKVIHLIPSRHHSKLVFAYSKPNL